MSSMDLNGSDTNGGTDSNATKIDRNLASIKAMTDVLTAAIFPVGKVLDCQSDGEKDHPVVIARSSTRPVDNFHFLGLPLEISNMIYDLLIVSNPWNADPNVVYKEERPYLMCSAHLVCRAVSTKILAVVRQLPKKDFTLRCRVGIPKELFITKSRSGVLGYPAIHSVDLDIVIPTAQIQGYQTNMESKIMYVHHVKQFQPELPRFCCWLKIDSLDLWESVPFGSDSEEAEISGNENIMFHSFDGWRSSRCGSGNKPLKVEVELAVDAYLEKSGTTPYR